MPRMWLSRPGSPSRRTSIPWEHRAQLGRLRAYWQTVVFVTFQYKRFCTEIARPIDSRAARRFRWVTVAHILAPLALVAVCFIAMSEPGRVVSILGFSVSSTRLVVVAWAALALALATVMCTGLPALFFHPADMPPRQQHTAVAMSHYALAPLAWAPIPGVVAVAATALPPMPVYGIPGMALALAAALLLFAQMLIWWIDLRRIARRVMPDRPWRARAILVILPLMTVGTAAILVIGVPSGLFYIAIIVDSLR